MESAVRVRGPSSPRYTAGEFALFVRWRGAGRPVPSPSESRRLRRRGRRRGYDCEHTADQIRTTCRTAVGDSLRSVTYFTRDDFEQLYLRSDLARDADLSTFIGHEWRGFKTTQTAYDGSELGSYRYTIRVFDNGFLVRVTTDREGVFVTTDGLTMKDFEEVATALGAVLEDRSRA